MQNEYEEESFVVISSPVAEQAYITMDGAIRVILVASSILDTGSVCSLKDQH